MTLAGKMVMTLQVIIALIMVLGKIKQDPMAIQFTRTPTKELVALSVPMPLVAITTINLSGINFPPPIHHRSL
jgi:hypothetical protein